MGPDRYEHILQPNILTISIGKKTPIKISHLKQLLQKRHGLYIYMLSVVRDLRWDIELSDT